MPSLSALERSSRLDALERGAFDLAVIGGGITGAGLAALAARRGLRVALLEADDFASGTSSRSSKLIHGGLRYLAMGDVALVRETALERAKLHSLAPHLAEPRWLVVPARSWAGVLKLRAGVTTYEKLGAVAAEDAHRNWSAEDLAREEPAIDRRTFPHALAYREYLTDDARLVLANLRAAARDGAVAVSHAPVESIAVAGGRAAGLEARCRHSGRRVRVRARCLVNAAGPWVEAVRRLESPGAPPLLHLSKGVHLVLRAGALSLRHMVILVASDRRSIFAIPRGEGVYVGTTDTSFGAGPTHWPTIDPDDVAYLLEPLARSFDVPPIGTEDVVAGWAGLRPLIAEPGKSAAEISRKDEISVGPAGVVTIAGGKLTGYRPMVARALDVAARSAEIQMGDDRGEPPLPGGDFAGALGELAASLARELGVEPSAADRIARLYGGEARAVAALGGAPLAPGTSVLAGEVEWAVREEGAETLEDLVYRRLRVALFEPGQRDPCAEAGALRMGELLGWSAEARARELAAVRARYGAELARIRQAPAGAEEVA
jgi:glycerol-3-phosphate dehydrogenase